MKKTAILPIITVLALAIGNLTGHQITTDVIDLISTILAVVVTAGISIWGVWKDHKKKVKNKIK